MNVMTTGLLADEDRFLALDEGRIHEAVVDHDIGGRQCIIPAHGYQSRITGACAHDPYPAPAVGGCAYGATAIRARSLSFSRQDSLASDEESLLGDIDSTLSK
jgi:hypothetical protein